MLLEAPPKCAVVLDITLETAMIQHVKRALPIHIHQQEQQLHALVAPVDFLVLSMHQRVSLAPQLRYALPIKPSIAPQLPPTCVVAQDNIMLEEAQHAVNALQGFTQWMALQALVVLVFQAHIVLMAAARVQIAL